MWKVRDGETPTIMTMYGKTFFAKPCDYCGSTNVTYSEVGPHIKAACLDCFRETFTPQINEKNWARFVKERAGYRCERCGKAVQGRGAHAHHKVPKFFMPALALDPDNGICLCTECHKQVHGGCGTIREAEA